MAKTRHSDLQSKDNRSKLKVRPAPYFVRIEPGVFLGYRRLAGAGSWVGRRYSAVTRRNVHNALGTADDLRPADGATVLTYAEAQRKLLSEETQRGEAVSGKSYTVANAISDYIEYMRHECKTADDTEIKLNAYLLSFTDSRGVLFGQKRLSELQPHDFDEWLRWGLRRTKRFKAKKPKPEPKYRRKSLQRARKAAKPREAIDADELRRRRKSTLNRVITAVKAALNRAHSRRKVASPAAWAGLKKFKGADAARLRWLTEEEAKRLTNAATSDLRRLMHGGLMTGCRPSELARAKARDFDTDSQTLLVAESKTSTPRRVPLTKEGAALLESITAGKAPGDLIFTRADGSAWNAAAVVRGMQAASDAAGIAPRATFYSLRHSYASHLAQRGTPLIFIAAALGHKNTRMVEKHYSHFSKSHVAEEIKAKLPTFGLTVQPQKQQKVRRLRTR
jgi:integrase